MLTTRRRFLTVTGSGLVATMARPAVLRAAKSDAARRKLAQRRRRAIFNDDGDDVWHIDAGTPEGFLEIRIKHILGTQVDSLYYSTTQSFNYYTHNTRVGEVFLSRAGGYKHNNMEALIRADTDPLRLAMGFARKHNIEAVWTLRMNDIHDAFTPPLYPQWKRDHPDALLGKDGDFGKYPASGQRHWWPGVNFNRPDVRTRTVELIVEVAKNYDVDAIDLDWLRHPIHFPETLNGQAVTPDAINLITALLREIRTALGEIGDRRGRPILLAARVPMTVQHGLYMGTDIETWLKQGLVDFVTIGGGYVPFSMPTGEIAALGKRHGVPVYACISHSGMMRRKPYGPGTPYAIEGWRAAAANALDAGADGVSLFNLFPAPGDDSINKLARLVFSECGQAGTLAGKDKLFCLDNAAHLDRCGYINHVVPYRDCLPKRIAPSKSTSAKLAVGENVAAARATTLRIQLDKAAPVACRINGQRIAMQLADGLTQRFGMVWYTGDIKPKVVRRGGNDIAVWIGGILSEPTNLTEPDLFVIKPKVARQGGDDFDGEEGDTISAPINLTGLELFVKYA